MLFVHKIPLKFIKTKHNTPPQAPQRGARYIHSFFSTIKSYQNNSSYVKALYHCDPYYLPLQSIARWLKHPNATGVSRPSYQISLTELGAKNKKKKTENENEKHIKWSKKIKPTMKVFTLFTRQPDLVCNKMKIPNPCNTTTLSPFIAQAR